MKFEPTPAQMAFTHWFLGAQLMAHRQYADALEVFNTAHAYNQDAGDEPEGRLMLEGYIGLTTLLAGRIGSGEAKYCAAVAALRARESDDSEFYAEQLITARAVFMEKRDL